MLFFSIESLRMNLYSDMDAKRAEQIARNFLQQYHSIFYIKTNFENGIWLIEAKVSAFGERIKKLRIDDKTGVIIAGE